MKRKIVAPVDGSAASEHVIPHVAGLARVVDAEVILVHVAGRGSRAGNKGRDYLEGLRRRCSHHLPGALTALRFGEPACEILKFAASEHADLVALTTRGGSSMRRILFGSTAIELMRSSPVPLLVVRPEFPARLVAKILVAVDGTRSSRSILEWVRDLAQGNESEVLLLRTIGPGNSSERASAALRRLAGTLSRGGIPARTVLAAGDPARAIVQSALDLPADLIAMGTRGRRATDRFFFGSLAESVLLASRVPMLLQRTVRVSRANRRLVSGARA